MENKVQILDSIAKKSGVSVLKAIGLFASFVLLVFGILIDEVNEYYIHDVDFFYLASILGGLGKILGLFLMIKDGTIRKASRFYGVILMLLVVWGVGYLFKVQHYPGGQMMYTLGHFGIPIVYTIWFDRKKNKGMLDVFKFAWVVTIFILALNTVFELSFMRETLLLERLTFLTLFGVYISKGSSQNQD